MKVEPRKFIQNILESKAALKQDIYQDTLNLFKTFKELINQEIEALKESVTDERIRLRVEDGGDFETRVYIGSDVLVFHMHTNVFKLPDDSPIWQTDYLKEDKQRGYFGMILIYNFLADSYLKTRLNDVGYLIGRIFINKEEHFMVEGKGQLGFLFRDITQSKLNEAIMCNIIQVAFVFALEFDLFTPPYDVISKVSVNQMLELNSRENVSTGKRLGFKFEAEDKDIF